MTVILTTNVQFAEHCFGIMSESVRIEKLKELFSRCVV